MAMRRQNDLAQIKSALGNFRRLSDRVLSDDDDRDVIDPALFEQLSLVAAEIAELERSRRRRRRDRALAIAQQVSELFPDMAGRGGAFARLGDENLDRSAIAIQLAVEANDQLAEADAELRTAVENRDYGSVRDHAGRAREHQAAIAAQKDILASLLALVADDEGDSDGDGDTMDSPPPPGGRHEFADNGASDMAAHREAEPSLADAGRTAMAAEANPELTRAEPKFASAPTVADKPVVDTSVAAPVSDNVQAAAILAGPVGAEAASIAVDIRQEHVAAEAGGAVRRVDGASAAPEDRASFVIRNGLMIPEPLARKSKDPKFTEELTKRFESARENVRVRLEGDNQPGSGGLLTKFRRGRMPGTGMAEAD